MAPHQERVLNEQGEVLEFTNAMRVRFAALDKFVHTELFSSLPQDERDRLIAQRAAMLLALVQLDLVADILTQRIAAF